MKIIQTVGTTLVARQLRLRLESTTFPSMEQAKREVQTLFPNHLVASEPGGITVTLKDKSFQVAAFREVHDPLRRMML